MLPFMSRIPPSLMAAALLAACAGCYPAVKGTYVVDARGGVESGEGWGAGLSLSHEYGLASVVLEAVTMDLEGDASDRGDALQTRLYGKVNVPILVGDRFAAGFGPILGMSYVDLDDAPGWSVDHTSVFAGAELSVIFGELPSGVFFNVRWAWADWELDRDGSPERDMSQLELSLGVLIEF